MRFLLCSILSVLFTFTSFAERAVTPFSSVKANLRAQKFQNSYKIVYEKFKNSMTTARVSAAKQGNIEEIKKIQSALSGDFKGELTTSAAKNAMRSFKYSLSRLCKDYILDLKKAIKDELATGNIENAEEIQSTINKLERTLTSTTPVTKTCRIDAEKDWQESKISVHQGDKLTIYSSGTWTPNGQASRQDANVYNIQIKVGDSIPTQAGKKKIIIADSSGEIYFRMIPPRKRHKKDAHGSLSIKVIREPQDLFQEMHDLVLGKVKQPPQSPEETVLQTKKPTKKQRKAEKKKELAVSKKSPIQEDFIPHPPDYVVPKESTIRPMIQKSKTVTVVANKDWQSSKVIVPAGTPVLIKAEGKWTRGKKKNGDVQWKDVKSLKLVCKIGHGKIIQSKGEQWLINQKDNKGGLLRFRMYK